VLEEEHVRGNTIRIFAPEETSHHTTSTRFVQLELPGIPALHPSDDQKGARRNDPGQRQSVRQRGGELSAPKVTSASLQSRHEVSPFESFQSFLLKFFQISA